MIDDRTVRHVARLARLDLDPSDLAALAEDLGKILSHMEQLGRADTDDVDPTFHPRGQMSGVTRPDQARPGLDRDQVLAMAPDVEGSMVRVPGMMSSGGGDGP